MQLLVDCANIAFRVDVAFSAGNISDLVTKVVSKITTQSLDDSLTSAAVPAAVTRTEVD